MTTEEKIKKMKKVRNYLLLATALLAGWSWSGASILPKHSHAYRSINIDQTCDQDERCICKYTDSTSGDYLVVDDTKIVDARISSSEITPSMLNDAYSYYSINMSTRQFARNILSSPKFREESSNIYLTKGEKK